MIEQHMTDTDKANKSLHILVVEDNADAGFLACEMLGALGHQTLSCVSGEDAKNALQARRFDLLFTDVQLPGISGVELARSSLLAQPWLKVIFASGMRGPLAAHVAFPVVSLQKPYDFAQLEAALRQLTQA